MSLKWIWPVNRWHWAFYNVEACIIQHEKAIARPRHPLFNALSCCNNVCRWACVFPLAALCRRLYFICFISFLTCWYVECFLAASRSKWPILSTLVSYGFLVVTNSFRYWAVWLLFTIGLGWFTKSGPVMIQLWARDHRNASRWKVELLFQSLTH